MASKENRREKRALDEVQSGRIPRQTLNDRVHNKARSGTIGRPCRLSREEEKEIVESCVIFSEWGYGIGKKEVMGLVADYYKENNIRNGYTVPTRQVLIFVVGHKELLVRREPSLLSM